MNQARSFTKNAPAAASLPGVGGTKHCRRKRVAEWPEVRECHMLAGEADFLLKIVAENWDAYQRFLTTKLTAAKNVSHVKSALAIRSAKQLPGVPIDEEPPAPV